MKMRENWEETFVQILRVYEQRSTCLKYKVAAIFVRNNRIISAGYNGVPKNEPHCTDLGFCAKDRGQAWCNGAHAEMNGIVNAVSEGINLSDTSLFCTYNPCMSCAKQLANLRIKKLIYLKNYKTSQGEEGYYALKLLERSGTIIHKHQ